MMSKKITSFIFALALLPLLSSVAHSGFCDSQGAQQTLSNVHLFGGRAYLVFSPGFSGGGDAETCVRNEAYLNMSNPGFDSFYSMALTALASGMPVQFTYCGPCTAHGYNGPSFQVTEITGMRISE